MISHCDNKYSETDREEQERFIFFCNGKVYEHAAHGPHNDDIPLEVEYPGCMEGTMQHVQYFISRHVEILSGI